MNGKIVFVALGFLSVVVEGEEWGYGETNGPERWASVFDYTICSDDHQSPIDIVTDDAVLDKDLPRVDRTLFYAPPATMTLSNNGHTLVMTFTSGGYTIADRRLLPFDAKIAQYHFHWGTTSMSGGTITHTGGSEHTIDGKRYFGELHAVHYNTKYGSFSEASSKSDGLAVFAWFISVTYPETNQDFKYLLDLAVTYAQYKDNSSAIEPTFSLETLIPANLDDYFRYQGSLTTPPCSESVTWTVFADAIEITPEQAQILSGSFYVADTKANPLVNNYRPVQALNDRIVYKPPAVVQSGRSTVARPTILAVLLGFALVYFL